MDRRFRRPGFSVAVLVTILVAIGLLMPQQVGMSQAADRLPEGVDRVRVWNYADCVRLSNGTTQVVLGHHVGGRVLHYTFEGAEALYLDPREAAWEPKPNADRRPIASAGRFDIGPEYLIPRRDTLWSGEWRVEIVGPRAARLVSRIDANTGVQLTRDFRLAPTGSHLACTQTIHNRSDRSVSWCHWSRTFAIHGGIGVVPLTPETTKMPNGYVMYEGRGLMNFTPTDAKIQQREGFLEILGPPAQPKLGFDSMAGWFAYQMPNDLLFLKHYPNVSKNTPLMAAVHQ